MSELVGSAGIVSVALAAVIIAAIVARTRAASGSLAAELKRARERAQRHAQHSSTLVKAASELRLDDAERMQALMDRLAASLRAEQPFAALFGVIEGAAVAVLARSGVSAGPSETLPIPVGSRLPLAETIVPELIAEGGVVAWDDLTRTAIPAARPAVRAQSAIGTAFRVGMRTYVLSFTGERALREPFDASDREYVELLAHIVAQRLRHRDQTERLRFNAEHDMLTELPNRGRLRSDLARLRTPGATGAMIVIDFDRFREISQTLGHQTADAIIVEAAVALRQLAGPADLVARLGTDVFAFYAPDTDRDQAQARAEAIAQRFGQPFGTGDRDGYDQIRLTASIGVALAPDDAEGDEDLLGRAETAVALAKAAGRDQIVFFAPAAETIREGRRVLRSELARALHESQFALHYQPIIDLDRDAVIGVEALVRWNHPTRGLLVPDRFVPFAERNGLIGDIGRWVLERALADIERIDAAQWGIVVHVNVTPNEIREARFIRELRQRLEANPALAPHLGIEITESGAMHDPVRTDRVLRELRELGIMTSIDDFGTGHSSMARLKNYPVDALKIDRAFVAGLPHDSYDTMVLDALLGLARRLGFTTVAEGVENEAQLAWLRARGVSRAQGYAIAPPMTVGALLSWLSFRDVARSVSEGSP